MATSKKPQYPKVRTPKGVFGYVWIAKPDTKWKAEGEYKVDLTFPSDTDEAKAFVKAVADMLEVARAEAEDKLAQAYASATGSKKGEAKKKKESLGVADLPIKEVLDEEGEPTGDVKITAKMPAKVTRKADQKVFHLKPNVVDGVGNKIAHDALNIGPGTEGKLRVELRPYYNPKDNVAGVSIRLETVRVLKLVEFGSGGSTGFEDDDEMGEDLSDRVRSESKSSAFGRIDADDDDDDSDPDFA